MRTWPDILQQFPVEDLLFDLVKESILAMQEKSSEPLTRFELFCNLKYGYIFLSANTSAQALVAIPADKGMERPAQAAPILEARDWTYYQFNTDTPGIREAWRTRWEKVQKFLSDDLYEEYLDFLNINEQEANRQQAENEQAFRQTVEKVYERICNEVLRETPGLQSVGTQIVFEENYY